MREIKFRGKTKDTGIFVYGNYVYLYMDSPMLETNSKYEYYSIQDWENAAEYEIDPATIGQYTGLKDRNGTEIYEGDIAEWKDTDGNRRVDVVRYTYGGFHLCNTCYPVGHYTVHIIGNVHDNPELLGSEVE